MPRLAAVLLCLLTALSAAAAAEGLWMTLPPTPALPQPQESGLVPVNGVRIWYARQVPALAAHYQVVVMDSRGHSRSSRDARPFDYDLMTDDVLGLTWPGPNLAHELRRGGIAVDCLHPGTVQRAPRPDCWCESTSSR